ncbi:MAG: RNA polymerase sigma factor [Ignavibacteriales bacterium]
MASPPTASQGADRPVRDEDLQAWMVQYGPALRRYFLKKASPAEAEDLVQDVFLAMRTRGAGAAIENVEGYLFRIAAHVLARRYGPGGWDWRRSAGAIDDDALHEEISPERALIGKQSVARLLTAIEALPPRMGEAFALHRFEEMTYPAIGRRMGISPRTVEKLISLALKRLILEVEGVQ